MPTVNGIIKIPNQIETAKNMSEKRSIRGKDSSPPINANLKSVVIFLPKGEYLILSKLIFILNLKNCVIVSVVDFYFAVGVLGNCGLELLYVFGDVCGVVAYIFLDDAAVFAVNDVELDRG